MRDDAEALAHHAAHVTHHLLHDLPLPKEHVVPLLDAGVNVCEMSLDCLRTRQLRMGEIVRVSIN